MARRGRRSESATTRRARRRAELDPEEEQFNEWVAGFSPADAPYLQQHMRCSGFSGTGETRRAADEYLKVCCTPRSLLRYK